MSYSQFGIEAKKALLDKKMTASELAEKLGISNSYLTEIFAGTRKGKRQKPKIIKILELNELKETNM